MKKVGVPGWLLIAASFLVSACGAGDGASLDSDDGDAVGELSQPLGDWSVRYAKASSERVEHVGPKYSVVTRTEYIDPATGFLPYEQPEVVLTATGAKLTVTPLPFTLLPQVDSVASDANNLVFLDSRLRRVYAYRPSTETTGAWALIATFTSDAILEGAALTATQAFIEVQGGVYRSSLSHTIPLTSEPPSSPENIRLIAGSQSWRLLGGHPQHVYIADSGGVSNIKQVTPQGTTRTLATNVDSPDSFTEDASYYWFTDRSSSIRRVRRILKSNNALSTYMQSNQVYFHTLYPTGSALYWVEQSPSPTSFTLRRTNRLTGEHATIPFPYGSSFVGTSTGIYVRASDGIRHGTL